MSNFVTELTYLNKTVTVADAVIRSIELLTMNNVVIGDICECITTSGTCNNHSYSIGAMCTNKLVCEFVLVIDLLFRSTPLKYRLAIDSKCHTLRCNEMARSDVINRLHNGNNQSAIRTSYNLLNSNNLTIFVKCIFGFALIEFTVFIHFCNTSYCTAIKALVNVNFSTTGLVSDTNSFIYLVLMIFGNHSKADVH